MPSIFIGWGLICGGLPYPYRTLISSSPTRLEDIEGYERMTIIILWRMNDFKTIEHVAKHR
jgi:hypothetical protein